jgi:hypothetical protein
MPVLVFPAMFASPQVGCPIGARIRFGAPMTGRARRKRRPRRARLSLSLLTTSGPHEATLAAITLYGATLDARSRLRRRELVALRLPSGRRVKARVSWRLGRRCGVTFLTPVADFAHLLRECRLPLRRRAAHRPSTATSTSQFVRSHWIRPLTIAVAKVQRMGRQLLRWCRSL